MFVERNLLTFFCPQVALRDPVQITDPGFSGVVKKTQGSSFFRIGLFQGSQDIPDDRCAIGMLCNRFWITNAHPPPSGALLVLEMSYFIEIFCQIMCVLL